MSRAPTVKMPVVLWMVVGVVRAWMSVRVVVKFAVTAALSVCRLMREVKALAVFAWVSWTPVRMFLSWSRSPESPLISSRVCCRWGFCGILRE